jgi:hypothetical protein
MSLGMGAKHPMCISWKCLQFAFRPHSCRLLYLVTDLPITLRGLQALPRQPGWRAEVHRCHFEVPLSIRQAIDGALARNPVLAGIQHPNVIGFRLVTVFGISPRKDWGARELLKGFVMIENSLYGNV